MDKVELERRTKSFALGVISFVSMLPRNRVGDVLGRQLMKCGTSIGANYREANRAESRSDFIHKIAIVEKEAAEADYWLEICSDAGLGEAGERDRLSGEVRELLAIFTRIGKTTKEKTRSESEIRRRLKRPLDAAGREQSAAAQDPMAKKTMLLSISKSEIRNSKFEIFLILAAAGSGRRLGRDEPKALVPLLGRPLLSWTLDALIPLAFSRTIVVAPPDRTAEFERLVRGKPGVAVVPGGASRSASVRRGFEALAADPADLICVHDAARPLIATEEALAVLQKAAVTGAATAGIPIVDTVKRVEREHIVATIDREGLYAAGTPQAFRAELLRRAFDTGREATDEAGLLELLGVPVAVVPVSRWNLKITTQEDLDLAEAMLRRRTR